MRKIAIVGSVAGFIESVLGNAHALDTVDAFLRAKAIVSGAHLHAQDPIKAMQFTQQITPSAHLQLGSGTSDARPQPVARIKNDPRTKQTDSTQASDSTLPKMPVATQSASDSNGTTSSLSNAGQTVGNPHYPILLQNAAEQLCPKVPSAYQNLVKMAKPN